MLASDVLVQLVIAAITTAPSGMTPLLAAARDGVKAERVLPAELIHRPKQAFHTPTAGWFRSARGRAMLGDLLLGHDRGLLARAEVERLFQAHQRGEDHDQALWNLAILELWLRAYVDQPPVASWRTGA